MRQKKHKQLQQMESLMLAPVVSFAGTGLGLGTVANCLQKFKNEPKTPFAPACLGHNNNL